MMKNSTVKTEAYHPVEPLEILCEACGHEFKRADFDELGPCPKCKATFEYFTVLNEEEALASRGYKPSTNRRHKR